MCVARRACATMVLAFAVACVSCDQGSPDVAPKQASKNTEQRSPTTKADAAPKPLVEVTSRAAKSVREVVEAQAMPNTWALRLETYWPKGICSPQHRLKIDTDPASPEDHVFASGGIKVVVLKRQMEMFRGAQIDYGEKNGEHGFLVNNPNFEGELLKKWGPIVAADPLSTGN